MPMTRQAKEQMLSELTEKLNRAKAALVADYAGLNVAAVTEIRRAFRSAGVEYRVVKNTLVKRALKGTPREKIAKVFTRTTAVAFKFDEEFGKLGKIAQDLGRKFEKLQFKGGFVADDVLEGPGALDTMAALPTLDEARAQLLGLLNAPASKLLATMNAPGSHLLSVIQAKADKG